MPKHMLVILLTILGLAVLFDLRERRIPNVLIVLGLVAGVVGSFMTEGTPGFLDSLGGMVLGMALFLPFFIPRLVGAGDVKLFGVVGGFVGLGAVLPVFFFTLILGGVLGILAVSLSHRWTTFFGNLKVFLISIQYGVKGAEMALSDVATQSAVRIPYAVAIAMGSIVWIVSQS